MIRISGMAAGLLVGLIVLWASGLLRSPGGPSPPAAPAARTAVPEEPPGPWDASLGSEPRFVDVTGASGVDFLHTNGRSGRYHYLEIMGAGVGLLDYDGDGLLDIYFVNGNRIGEQASPEVSNRLYRNEGGLAFRDGTARAGVGGNGAFGQGCAAGDYDNDGDIDLYVSNFGPNILYRNEAGGAFTDVAAAAGVADPGWGQSSTFLDFDGDGWLDLFVENYLTYDPAREVEAFIHVGDRKLRDYPSPSSYPGAPDRLYRNDGRGAFADVSAAAGLVRTDGKGMGCAAVDFDGDGRVDIFVANDAVENFLYRGLGGGAFEEVGLAAGVAYDGGGIPESSMGADVGDFDGDGLLDLIVPSIKKQVFTLYRNRGSWFDDVSFAAGLGPATSEATGFSPNFLDYDNDGDLDLFFTTGGVRADERVPEDAPYEARYGMPDLLLASDGKGRYADVSRRAGPHFRRATIGRGAAAGDLDDDGRIDLVVSNLAGRPAVLRNETASGHWTTLRLVPASGNRDALGASVWVEAGGRKRRAAVHGGVTYLSQNDRRVHFGLGPAARIDRLEVLWPSGRREEIRDVPVDRVLTVREGEGRAR